MITEYWIKNRRYYSVYQEGICIAIVSDKNVALRLDGKPDLSGHVPEMLISKDGQEYLMIKNFGK